MKISSQKTICHYLHKMETCPLLCVINAVVILVFKFMYRNTCFSNHGYIQAYSQDKTIKCCILNILGKPNKTSLGLRETVLKAHEAKKNNLRLEFSRLKQNLRFDFFPHKKEEMKNDPALLFHVLKLIPCISGQVQHFPNFTRAFAEKLLSFNGRILWYLNSTYKNDEHFVELACRQDGASLQDASQDLRENKRLALIAINTSAEVYLNLSKTLKLDQDIALEFLSKKQNMGYLLPDELKRDHDFYNRVFNRFGPLWQRN